MAQTQNNLTRLTHRIILVSFAIAIMYFAASILIPLAFAMFFALLFYPVCEFFERKLSRVLAILTTFLGVMIIISLILYFFGTQFYHLFENIKDFGSIIASSLDRAIETIDNTLWPGEGSLRDFMEGEQDNAMARNLIESTISKSTGFIVAFGLVIVFAFLFLLYRSSFKKLILYYFPDEKKDQMADMLSNIQKVAQNYFFGLIIVILILGTLNGLGLWIIGLDFPFLFGYFAALLAIIPYIGTFIGGLLPTLYALLNFENIWPAVLVLIWYMFVQVLEGNFLTPKIAGSKVSLNPMIAILALIVGGLLWGIAGMVLFIPFMAVLKVIFDNNESLKPFGILFSSDFGSKKLTITKKQEKEHSSEE